MKEHWPRHVPVVSLDTAAVSRLVLPLFPGNDIVSIEPIKGGLTNTNIKICLSHRTGALLLRIYQRGIAPAQKEMAVYRLVGGRVPVPRFIHFSPESSVASHPYAVLDWIEGFELQTMFASLTADQLIALGVAIGRALASMHAFTFDTFGFLDADLRVQGPIDIDKHGLIVYLKQCLVDGRGGPRIGPELTSALLDFTRREGDILKAWLTQPCLVHGDFNGSNILIHKIQDRAWDIGAIIDWEYALSASPAFDFGNVLRPPFDANDDFAAALARGYLNGGGMLPDQWRRIAKLADMFSFADILSRPAINDVVVEDAKAVISKLIAS